MRPGYPHLSEPARSTMFKSEYFFCPQSLVTWILIWKTVWDHDDLSLWIVCLKVLLAWDWDISF